LKLLIVTFNFSWVLEIIWIPSYICNPMSFYSFLLQLKSTKTCAHIIETLILLINLKDIIFKKILFMKVVQESIPFDH
jgi:hypothetical protein